MQADLALMTAADGGQKSNLGALINLGKASPAEFLKILSECAGHAQARSIRADARPDSPPLKVIVREDALPDHENFAGEFAESNHPYQVAVSGSASTGPTQSDPVAQAAPEQPPQPVPPPGSGAPVEPVTEGETPNTIRGDSPGEDGLPCDFTDAFLGSATVPGLSVCVEHGTLDGAPPVATVPGVSTTNFSATAQPTTAEQGVNGALPAAATPPETVAAPLTFSGQAVTTAVDLPAGQSAASAAEFPGMDLPANVPLQSSATDHAGYPTAAAEDAPSPGHPLQGPAPVPAGSDDGIAEGTIRAGSGVRPEVSSGGLQTPDLKASVPNSAEEGDVSVRPAAEVSAVQGAAIDSEASGGDVGDETFGKPASLSADCSPATDNPLLVSGDQPSFVEFLEDQGHTKASQAMPSSESTRLVTQLVERAVLSIKEGVSEIRIALKPEALGHLRIEITTENHQVAVKVIAETQLVKTLLDQNLTQLKQQLREQGLLMDKFDVLVAQDASQFAPGRQPAGYFQTQGTDRNQEDAESEAGARKENEEAPPRQSKDGNALIDYFA